MTRLLLVAAICLYTLGIAGCTRIATTDPDFHDGPSRAPQVVGFTWIHAPTDDPSEALRLRFREDKTFHGLLVIAGADTTGGPLLDPDSVHATWNGRDIPVYTYYKAVGTAIVFLAPEDTSFTSGEMGYLRIEAALLGEQRTALISEVPLLFDREDFSARAQNRAIRPGERVRVTTPEGAPISGAWFFGQRREDLVTRSDASGSFLLDAPSRSSALIHYAWKPGWWTRAFDPVHQRTVVLQPRETSSDVELNFTLVNASGERIPRALLLVADDYFVTWRNGLPQSIQIPNEDDVSALILAPGYTKRLIPITQLTTGAEIVLE